MKRKIKITSFLCALCFGLACTPTVKVEMPDKPIEINMNIKHEIKVKVDKDLNEVMESNDDIF